MSADTRGWDVTLWFADGTELRRHMAIRPTDMHYLSWRRAPRARVLTAAEAAMQTPTIAPAVETHDFRLAHRNDRLGRLIYEEW